jgi:hypothetical protein
MFVAKRDSDATKALRGRRTIAEVKIADFRHGATLRFSVPEAQREIASGLAERSVLNMHESGRRCELKVEVESHVPIITIGSEGQSALGLLWQPYIIYWDSEIESDFETMQQGADDTAAHGPRLQ